MKKFDFNKQFLDGDDQPTGKTLAHMLSTVIMQSISTKVPMKLFEISLQLKKGGVISLDTLDKDMMVEFITSHEGMYVLLKGQLLQVLK